MSHSAYECAGIVAKLVSEAETAKSERHPSAAKRVPPGCDRWHGHGSHAYGSIVRGSMATAGVDPLAEPNHRINGVDLSQPRAEAVRWTRSTTSGLDRHGRLSRCDDANAAFALTLLHLQEQERGRIARELHDGIGQSLSGAAFKLDRAAGTLNADLTAGGAADVVRQIAAVGVLIAETVAEVRRICSCLRPAILDDLGIVAALSWLCRDFQETHGGIRLTLDVVDDEDRIPEALKTDIFRIVQESLNNVAKHAAASDVFVGLRQTKRRIVLTISDNGCGTQMTDLGAHAAARGCCGLASMRKRVDLTGGSFNFASEQGVGTTVRASWGSRPSDS